MLCNAQVTFQQISNGLVSYYPLNTIFSGNVTPDAISRRDMTVVNISSNNLVAASHPGIEPAGLVMNFSQSGGPTVIYYESTGQNALDGSGDFLPFINQRNATMNFWIKGAVPGFQDLRIMAECANNGDNQPFFSLSDQPSSKTGLGYFLRESSPVTDPSGITANQFDDGTYQTPAFNYIWSQSSQYTTNAIFDNNWHMVTTEISSNGDVHVYVDGNYDPGNQSTVTLDNEGNPAIVPPLNVTNTYYITNVYPFSVPPTNAPPPNGFVRWMLCDLKDGTPKGALTAFGGFDRNGSIAAGPPCQLSDIGFWKRALSPAEIQFVMTNGVQYPWPPPPPPTVRFWQDFYEVASGDQVTLHWSVSGETNISISGLGDVTDLGFAASTNVTVDCDTNFTLTARNGLTADLKVTLDVKALSGVSSDWHLIQGFDGLFTNTTQGINGYGWIDVTGAYLGALDRFNVVTVNGNKALSARSDYVPDTNSPVGWDTPGALAYGVLNGLTIPPFQENTLFFRFSITNPRPIPSATNQWYSGLDFALGVTDFGFATGPIGGTQPPGGGGTVGPGIHILQYDPAGAYQPTAWDLTADDFSGSSVTNHYDYLTAATGNPNGLQTNVNYYCWLDISNNDTMFGGSNTINEPLYSFWIQKQGDSGPTLLFSNFHGDRDSAGQNSDYPMPYLNKIFVSVATENLLASDNGAFFATNNMIVLDDFYLSKTGYNHTIPRLFQIASIARGSANATITWYSLGSLLQTNTYTVQRTFSVTDPVWTTLTNGLPSGGDLTSFTDNTVGSNDAAFYRIAWP